MSDDRLPTIDVDIARRAVQTRGPLYDEVGWLPRHDRIALHGRPQ